jgi:Tol biopolymer transport system component
MLSLFLCAGVVCSSHAQVTSFAPGEVSTSASSNMAPAFSPDGKAVYFTEVPDQNTLSIVESQRVDGKWAAPHTAAFSGHDRDLEPAFAPSGKFLVFASNRPSAPGEPQLDGHYNGKLLHGGGGHLWKVEARRGSWTKPQLLPPSINVNDAVFSPAVTADGSLYFMRADDGGGVFHIYRSQFRHGHYETPVRASFSNTTYGDFDPAVAPDESYLIFSSGRPPAPSHVTDLFIIFRTPAGWGDPTDLRAAISDEVHGVEARLSPDGKTLYFTGPHPQDKGADPNARPIMKVSIAQVIATHGRS